MLSIVGVKDGTTVGMLVVRTVGLRVGFAEGAGVGLLLLGEALGGMLGSKVGNAEGHTVGQALGLREGRAVSPTLGRADGRGVGLTVGL